MLSFLRIVMVSLHSNDNPTKTMTIWVPCNSRSDESINRIPGRIMELSNRFLNFNSPFHDIGKLKLADISNSLK